jgi:hypothetical protein
MCLKTELIVQIDFNFNFGVGKYFFHLDFFLYVFIMGMHVVKINK